MNRLKKGKEARTNGLLRTQARCEENINMRTERKVNIRYDSAARLLCHQITKGQVKNSPLKCELLIPKGYTMFYAAVEGRRKCLNMFMKPLKYSELGRGIAAIVNYFKMLDCDLILNVIFLKTPNPLFTVCTCFTIFGISALLTSIALTWGGGGKSPAPPMLVRRIFVRKLW